MSLTHPFAVTYLSAFGLSLGLVSNAAWAEPHEHVHGGDIESAIEGGQLVIENPVEVDASTGYLLFEGDFGDLNEGPNGTDAPGFDNEPGVFAVGSYLGFRGIGSLLAWDGSTWAVAASGISFTITDFSGDDITWTGSGLGSTTEGYIGIADSNGVIHEHVDMSISGTDSTTNPAAYLVSLALFHVANVGDTTTLAGDSTPFSLIINHGLSEAAFEAGVEARVVPVPAAAWLLLSGLAGLARFKRRAVLA